MSRKLSYLENYGGSETEAQQTNSPDRGNVQLVEVLLKEGKTVFHFIIYSIDMSDHKNRDEYNQHYYLMHGNQGGTDDYGGESEAQRQSNACQGCYDAKARCDRAVCNVQLSVAAPTDIIQTPSCTRCRERGIPCEGRLTKRAGDAANRHARQHSRGHVNIAPFPGASTGQSSQQYSYSGATTSPEQVAAQTYYSGYGDYNGSDDFTGTTNGYSNYGYNSGNLNAYAQQDSQTMYQTSSGYSLSSGSSYNPSTASSVSQEQMQVSTAMGWGPSYGTQDAFTQGGTTTPSSAPSQVSTYPNVSYSSQQGYPASSTYYPQYRNTW